MSSSSGHSSSSEDEDAVLTCNEGESSDEGEEAPADPSLRGQAGLLTASCPRQYFQDVGVRKSKHQLIPEDIPKEEFLAKFRKVFNRTCNESLEKATCHNEPHKRFRPSKDRRERHYHIAFKVSGNFAHLKVAKAMHRECGFNVSFSFKLKRFVANLEYLMVAGKKSTSDLDLVPAKYPSNLDLEVDLWLDSECFVFWFREFVFS